MSNHPLAGKQGLSDSGQASDNLSFDFSPAKPSGPIGTDPGLWLAEDAAGNHGINLIGDASDPFGSNSGAKVNYLANLQNLGGITSPQNSSGSGSGDWLSTPAVAAGGNSSSSLLGSNASGLDVVNQAKAGGGHGGGGGGGGGGTFTTTYGTGALQFKVTYDSSVTGARNASTIENAFATAIGYFTSNFTSPLGGATSANPVTVNLKVGWGEVDNSALPSGALGASFTNLETANYSDFAKALNQGTVVSSVPYDATSSTFGDPLAGTTHNYVIATAEAKAIGMTVPSSTTDGWVGFSSSAQWYFGTGKPTTLTQYDFIGIAEHEISEALGRVAQLGTTADLNGDLTGSGSNIATNAYTPFDLFRFDPGTNARSLSPGETAQYSFNDMTTLGTSFNTGSGDYGDWAVPPANQISLTGANDAYDAGAYAGVQYAALPNDTTAIDGLGYGKVTALSPVLA